MLASQARRGAFRHLTSASCAVTARVEPIAFSCALASISHQSSGSFTLPLRLSTQSALQLINQRCYATRAASRPKAHTGRTTSTRPRKTSGQGAKAKPAKKAASKPRKRAKTKAKAKAKAKPRAKPRRRVRKELTPEQKEAAAAKAKNATIRELKNTALKAPKKLPDTVYTVISAEKSKEAKGLAAKEASVKYRQLLPEEREHYNHIATENKSKNTATYKSWVESLPAEDIRKANLARQRLKRLGVKGFKNSIKDARQVKRPAAARLLFLKERFESGDMQGLGLVDAQRLIGREWNELPTNQKQKYFASELERRQQYVKDVKNIYHRDIVLNGNSKAAQALNA